MCIFFDRHNENALPFVTILVGVFENIEDVTVQLLVLRGADIPVKRVELMHLNTRHRHPDHGPLFTRANITTEVNELRLGLRRAEHGQEQADRRAKELADSRRRDGRRMRELEQSRERAEERAVPAEPEREALGSREANPQARETARSNVDADE